YRARFEPVHSVSCTGDWTGCGWEWAYFLREQGSHDFHALWHLLDGGLPFLDSWLQYATLFSLLNDRRNSCGACAPGTHDERPSVKTPQGRGVRWLAGKGADTALEGDGVIQSKAVCAPTPHSPHSKTLARTPARAEVNGAEAL